ncbi:MAG: hypothetical protein RL095_2907 [Verrucomicrobiota bacterium]
MVLFSLLLFRLWQLQVEEREKSNDYMRAKTMLSLEIPAVRGRILSADGVALADNEAQRDLVFLLQEFRQRPLGLSARTTENLNSELETMAQRLRRPCLVSRDEVGAEIQRLKAPVISLYKKLERANPRSEDLLKDGHFTQVAARAACAPLDPRRVKVFDKVSAGMRKLVMRQGALPEYLVFEEGEVYLDFGRTLWLSPQNGYRTTATAVAAIANRLAVLIGRSPEPALAEQVYQHLNQKPAIPFLALSDLNQAELAVVSQMMPAQAFKPGDLSPWLRGDPGAMPAVPGTQILTTPKRTWPLGECSSHLVGYTHFKRTGEEGGGSNSNYTFPELTGVTGLERSLDRTLAGSPGRRTAMINVSGFEQRGQTPQIDPPENGQTVVLTIDSRAQKIAAKLLGKQRGAFVLMDCYSGAILAMVSTPSYDPQQMNFGTYYRQMTEAVEGVDYRQQAFPTRNRCVYSGYAPGSVIKPVIALAAFTDPRFNPQATYLCDGAYNFGNAKVKCAHGGVHGPVDLAHAIEVSCNGYFIQQALNLKMERLQPMMLEAGLGRIPDYAALPGAESVKLSKSGIIPELDAKPGDYAYAGIGQGPVTVSPLQVCTYTAAIANGGRLMTPHVIQETRDSLSRRMIARYQPSVLHELPVSAAAIRELHRAMELVVSGDRGTAKAARGNGVRIAGKTGTAQVTNARNQILHENTWFTCYAPAEAPRWACTILVEDGKKGGGGTCGPIAREFFDQWLAAP